MTLSAQDLTSIANASHVHVVASLQASPSLSSLHLNNPFKKGTIPRKASYNAHEMQSGKELLSLGGPNHCIDGWSFLSRAISSLLAGDMHSARHFAYYAELRAALSLLGSGGVGIFDHDHFSLSGNGVFAKLQCIDGTHTIAWEALQSWAQSAGAAFLFSTAMPAGPAMIGDILQTLFPTAASGHRIVAGEILTDWGIDIRRTRVDRKSRNSSSYRPQVLTPINATAADCVEFVTSFWAAFEPYGPNRFDLLDKHIVRIAIAKQLSILGQTTLDTASYDRLDEVAQGWISLDFINRQVSAADHPLIEKARMTSAASSPFSMIARASLLLRVASAVTRYNLLQAGILTVAAIDSWLGSFCLSRSLVDSTPLPAEMSDLWFDVAEAVDRLDAIRAEKATAGQPVLGWHLAGDQTSALPRASEAERVGLWSLSAA